MIRKLFMNKPSKKDKIAWRCHDVLRIEAFSDGVFAFVISLLIVSLEVPKSSKELLEIMKGFLPFALCFAFILGMWHHQYKFFRRYGLHDKRTIMINACFIFMVLVYVFPLKFILNNIFFGHIYKLHDADKGILFLFYNGGLGVINALFAWMYLHAYRKRDELGLTRQETFETIFFMSYFVAPAFVAFIATFIVFIYRNSDMNHISMCFVAYGLLGIFMPLLGVIRDRQFKKRFGNEVIIEPHLLEE
ncbi:MAG: hypothetical protein JWQ38_3651 [Flavipsychrobacter sp.]|nr:hypothetical protein [Flavipsychrobacter sp.]